MSPTKTKEAPSRPSAKVAGPPADTPVPSQVPQGLVGAVADGRNAPVLAPPDSEAAALIGAQAEVAGIAAWQSVTIGGMWTSNHQSNAWAYLNGIGWRRISPSNAVSHHAMLSILRLARDANLTAQCDEDGSVIHNVYVW
jgi:hypothetical protein